MRNDTYLLEKINFKINWSELLFLVAPARPANATRSGEDSTDWLPGDVGQRIVATFESMGEASVINSEQVHHRGVEIVHPLKPGELPDAAAVGLSKDASASVPNPVVLRARKARRQIGFSGSMEKFIARRSTIPKSERLNP